MIRHAALLLLLAALPLLAGELDPLLGKLKDPATREEAARALVEKGTPTLKELKEAARDPALKEQVEAIAKEIEAREPRGLRFHVSLPETRLSLAHVNGEDMKVAIGVENRGTETIVLWPYLSLRILDAKGQEVKRCLHIGRWGRGRSKRWLEDLKYIELAPGANWVTLTPLSRFMLDESFIEGWEVPEPGVFTIEVTYRFDRAKVKRTCDPRWDALDDPRQPWNRALEMTHVFTAEMTVAER
ncbi:MAG TPA: hypothetical protein VFY93_00915 [Planctomycetota bacterium]|nr:hypothetical protein [Planctomycetota bacterium]